MSDLYAIEKVYHGLQDAGAVLGLLGFGLLVLFLIAPYFIHGYALMCTGRKAKVSGDFMPFIPIGRQIYQMKIARCPVWYIFFFGISTITVVLCGLIWFLLNKLTGDNYAIASVVIFIYVIANMVITFLYYKEFYKDFGFNPNAAWLNIIPVFGAVTATFGMMIAFSNSIRHGKYVEPDGNGRGGNPPSVPQNKGIVVGVAGAYTDAKFDLVDGAELIFGRSPQDANIVFDQTATDVSRKHCSVRYDGRARQYVVTDYSTTGTYLENGTRLESGQPKQVACGTVIYLGSTKKNGFRLN